MIAGPGADHAHDGAAPVDPQHVVDPQHLEQVVRGTQLVGGLIAASLASLEPPLTMPQWRALVLASQGDANVSAIAADLQVHMSNATRTCDRLAELGLVSRRRADHDRRHVILELTAEGQRLYDAAMAFRRDRLRQWMAHMDPGDQADLARATSLLVEARGQHPADAEDAR